MKSDTPFYNNPPILPNPPFLWQKSEAVGVNLNWSRVPGFYVFVINSAYC